jgi:predicted RNase H-like nuclease
MGTRSPQRLTSRSESFSLSLRERSLGNSFTYRDACSLSESVTGKKISKQAWQIFPKILEIDDLFTGDPSLQNRLIEVHPEVTFAAWAGEPILEPKKKAPGFSRRRALVDSHFGPAAYDAVRSRYRVKHVAHDDILDAFAALWTAERELAGRSRRLPENPPLDFRGLRMEIVY